MDEHDQLSGFTVAFQAQWSDMDQNGHMRTTAYLAAAENSRMQFFAANGFSMSELTRLSIGPVVQSDEIRYRSEMRLLDTARLEVHLAGLSPEGARFSLRNVFITPDDKPTCIVTTVGGWLDLKRRRLTAPPEALLAVLNTLTRTDDFVEMTSPLARTTEPPATLTPAQITTKR